MSSPQLDHLGIAVSDLDAAASLYRGLGFQVSGFEEIAHEGVRVAMLPFTEGRIELLEATSKDSAIGRFIARRGPGLHHVAIRVSDLSAAMAQLREQGVRLVSDEVKIGAGGHRYVFVHPASFGGVLLELVEEESTAGHR